MKLHKIKIEGFRRIYEAEFIFGDATFLIGINNVGKSSVLRAIEYLLSDKKKLDESDYYAVFQNNENKRYAGKVIFEAEFRNVPTEASSWRGFKGRIFDYAVPAGSNETGKMFTFRKVFELGKDVEVQMRQQERILKNAFKDCETIADYHNQGLDIRALIPELGSVDADKKITAAQRKKIDELEDLYDFSSKSDEWFTNPGGIPGNVLSKLPKYILIPAQHETSELDGDRGAFVQTLNELFEEVREESENYKQAQHYLNLLAAELDPSDANKEVGKMISEIDGILCDVFPNTKIVATANLNDPNKAIKPTFNIEMTSNVKTPVEYQGTGVIRSAVFALLRYKSSRDILKLTKHEYVRPLMIGFEEPELYLHPHAAKKMRDTIYSLAEKENNQIVCTTHSTYMIDLSQKPSQVLNNLTIREGKATVNEDGHEILHIDSQPFNISSVLELLQAEEKDYIKMLMRFDDEVVKTFFAKKVLVVEGDTEYLLIQESLKRMNDAKRSEILDAWHVIRARGKASLIPLVKYLELLDMDVSVIHDKDTGTERAEAFNAPIATAVADSEKCHVAVDCVETLLGYEPPLKDKPYKAFTHINNNWPEAWEDVTDPWKEFLDKVFK